MSVFERPIPRRALLIKAGVAGLGASLALAGSSTAPRRKDRATAGSVHLALLSDTHIPEDTNDSYRGFYPYQNLQQITRELISNRPDAVVITGDLARLSGQVGDYRNLERLLSPLARQRPVYMTVGNHDNRDNFLKVFAKLPGERQSVRGKYVVVAGLPAVRLIMLDSLFMVNKVPGLLGKAQRSWLQNYLRASDDTPTVLCFHHTLGDGDGDLLDLPRLYDIVEPIRKVKAIIFGHSHEYRFSRYKGIAQINLPATAYNFSDREPVGWVEARLTARTGQFILHATGGNKDQDGTTKTLAWRT